MILLSDLFLFTLVINQSINCYVFLNSENLNIKAILAKLLFKTESKKSKLLFNNKETNMLAQVKIFYSYFFEFCMNFLKRI